MSIECVDDSLMTASRLIVIQIRFVDRDALLQGHGVADPAMPRSDCRHHLHRYGDKNLGLVVSWFSRRAGDLKSSRPSTSHVTDEMNSC